MQQSSRSLYPAIFQQCIIEQLESIHVEEINYKDIPKSFAAVSNNFFPSQYTTEGEFARTLSEKLILPMLEQGPQVCFWSSVLRYFWLRYDLSERKFLQVACVRCKYENPQGFSAGKIIPFHLSIDLSQSTISFLSASKDKVLQVIEIKSSDGDFGLETTSDAIKKTIYYCITVLAYSRWGLLGETGSTPLVSLLLFPGHLYRLSITKAEDQAFGLHLKVEHSSCEIAMIWILHEYVSCYKRDYSKTAGIPPQCNPVNPCSWAPINFDLAEGCTDFWRHPSLGFVFKTTARKFLEVVEKESDNCDCEFNALTKIPAGTVIVVKYLSKLLDIDCDLRVANLRRFITFTKEHQRVLNHPYVDITAFGANHYVVTMYYKGENLSVLKGTDQFTREWKDDSKLLARNFFKDIVETVLGLVFEFKACHNDIRMANIVMEVSEGKTRFCLIDFDMCNRMVRGDCASSRALMGLSRQSMLAVFSVAQLSLIAYELDTNVTRGVIKNIWSYWLKTIRPDSAGGPNIDQQNFVTWIETYPNRAMILHAPAQFEDPGSRRGNCETCLMSIFDLEARA
jgi:hypothetical protein